MSFLTPLYLLGAIAIVGPVLFHLIRRSPRGEVPFSSLMFLSPTPPRLTRRSRLDDWLLFLLRVAALCLLAFAFARPFLREAMALDTGDGEAKRVLILLDTSASMRRNDVWKQATARALEVLRHARPQDSIALYGFDATVEPVMTFEDAARLTSSQRAAIATLRLKEMEPTWRSTQLGAALVEAVALVEDVVDSSAKAAHLPRRIVLISDLQEGSDLKSLAGFEWPADVTLKLKTINAPRPNAAIHRLADADDAAADAASSLRVQVSNEAGNEIERFSVLWKAANHQTVGEPFEAYVPAGESRVFHIERPATKEPLESLDLMGDAGDFDNRAFIADRLRHDVTVLSVGDDPSDDPGGLAYYIERVFQDSPERTVHVERRSPRDQLSPIDPQATPLTIIGSDVTEEKAKLFREYAEAGGTILVVISNPAQAASLASLTGLPLDGIEEASVAGDVMLGEIAYRHPLFAPLAGPQYNDFTKIRFWKYRRLAAAHLADAEIIARFENGDPAIVEKGLGKGRVVLFASDWSPADSQLARSSKFVPLMMSLLALGQPEAFETGEIRVGDRVPLASLLASSSRAVAHVVLPSGESVPLAQNSEFFDRTTTPGVYLLETDGESTPFAVNIDPAESRTAALAVETLEQFGCKLDDGSSDPIAEAQSRRQMLNAELEGRQKLWRWIILAALGVLAVETWLAGRLTRPRRPPEEVLAT